MVELDANYRYNLLLNLKEVFEKELGPNPYRSATLESQLAIKLLEINTELEYLDELSARLIALNADLAKIPRFICE